MEENTFLMGSHQALEPQVLAQANPKKQHMILLSENFNAISMFQIERKADYQFWRKTWNVVVGYVQMFEWSHLLDILIEKKKNLG